MLLNKLCNFVLHIKIYKCYNLQMLYNKRLHVCLEISMKYCIYKFVVVSDKLHKMKILVEEIDESRFKKYHLELGLTVWFSIYLIHNESTNSRYENKKVERHCRIVQIFDHLQSFLSLHRVHLL